MLVEGVMMGQVKGIGLAVTKQTPTVTKGHLQYSHSTAPTVTQQPPCNFFVKNYTFKVSFASLKLIFLEKDLRESVKLAQNLYYNRFLTCKMQKWQLKERKFALLSNDNIQKTCHISKAVCLFYVLVP